jgi:hypothetical protein
MIPLDNVDRARALVDAFDGDPSEFALAVADRLLDPVGVNMALITDRALARGWEPDGFEQRVGFRIYRYKLME